MHDALLRCYESKTRGVQVQTFHDLVSSMLVNVYLNILFFVIHGSILYSEAAASHRTTLSVELMLFLPPPLPLPVFIKKYAAVAKCLIWRWALSVYFDQNELQTTSPPRAASCVCLAEQRAASGEVHVAGGQPPAVRESRVGLLQRDQLMFMFGLGIFCQVTDKHLHLIFNSKDLFAWDACSHSCDE